MSDSDVTLIPMNDPERENIRRALIVLASKDWKFESRAQGVISRQRVAIVFSWAEDDHGIFSIRFSPATYLLLGVDIMDRKPDARTLLANVIKLWVSTLVDDKRGPLRERLLN